MDTLCRGWRTSPKGMALVPGCMVAGYLRGRTASFSKGFAFFSDIVITGMGDSWLHVLSLEQPNLAGSSP